MLKDNEILSFIRDEMLTDPSSDAQFIYMCTHLAEKDDHMYKLLTEWMKDINNRNHIEKFITKRASYLNA